MSRYLIASSLAVILACSLPAARSARAAEIPGDTPSEAVKVYAADLSSGAGVARVHDRLERAARAVCQSFDSSGLGLTTQYRRCVAEALERAVRDVHDARLSAYHQVKTGETRTVAIVARSTAER